MRPCVLTACRLVGGIIIGMAYGFAPESEKDPCIVISEKVAKAVLNALAPGRYLVNMIPALKYIPAWLPGKVSRFCASGARLIAKCCM